MGNEDLRIYGGTQDFVKAAPVILVYIADFGRMNDTTDEFRIFFSAVDLGYISQNVYLWCASEGLASLNPAQFLLMERVLIYSADPWLLCA